jgi:23S rRNA U2552 (ribose-2'-O)-methylase RlmE/FtsJ
MDTNSQNSIEYPTDFNGNENDKEKPPWLNFLLIPGTQCNPTFTIKSLQNFPCIRQYYLEILRKKIANYEVSHLFHNDNWEYYKKLVNPYELVYTQCKYPNFPQSICILKPLSRSYFKMVELLEVFHFFDELRSEFQQFGLRTAHACEGPGGFIEAVWDLADKYKIRIVSSTAITLRSNHSNVPGWRRASNFLSKHKQIQIVYGEDKTGDILRIENQDSFINSVINGGGKVHLYTADGGLDFSENYENQESQIYPILLASARIGLGCLKKGGMMILKFFDIQNENTKQLIYIIQQCFTKWTLYKPAMSRPCNPEQYFVGIGFKYGQGSEIEIIKQMDKIQLLPPGLASLFPDGIPSDFLYNLDRFQEQLIEFQIKYLELIFQTIQKIHKEFFHSGSTEGPNREIKDLLKRNERLSYDWCVKFRMPHRSLPT